MGACRNYVDRFRTSVLRQPVAESSRRTLLPWEVSLALPFVVVVRVLTTILNLAFIFGHFRVLMAARLGLSGRQVSQECQYCVSSDGSVIAISDSSSVGRGLRSASPVFGVIWREVSTLRLVRYVPYGNGRY